MKARFSHITWLFVGLATLAGCPEKEEEETTTEKEDKKDPEPATAEPAKPEPTTDLKPEDSSPPVPGVTPAVKSALDTRKDGPEDGKKWAVAGARATMSTPDTLKQGKTGKFSSAATEDGKSTIMASSYSGDATTKQDEMIKAAGVTDCKWGNPEDIVTGKDDLAATASDGSCKKGDASVRVARVSFANEGLAVVTVWDESGGTSEPLFATVRGVEKAAGGGGGVDACCAALQSNAASAPPHQKGAYLAAFGACNALRSNPQGRQALGQVRALLAGANVPSSCL